MTHSLGFNAQPRWLTLHSRPSPGHVSSELTAPRNPPDSQDLPSLTVSSPPDPTPAGRTAFPMQWPYSQGCRWSVIVTHFPMNPRFSFLHNDSGPGRVPRAPPLPGCPQFVPRTITPSACEGSHRTLVHKQPRFLSELNKAPSPKRAKASRQWSFWTDSPVSGIHPGERIWNKGKKATPQQRWGQAKQWHGYLRTQASGKSAKHSSCHRGLSRTNTSPPTEPMGVRFCIPAYKHTETEVINLLWHEIQFSITYILYLSTVSKKF